MQTGIDHQEYLYKTSPLGALFNIIISSVLASYLWSFPIPKAVLLSWVFSMFLLNIVRIYTLKKHSKIIIKIGQKKFFNLFILGTILAGLLWSACYFLFAPYLAWQDRIIIIFIIGGMSAGAITSLSSSQTAYLSFIIPMVAPIIFASFFIVELQNTFVGVIATIYLIGITGSMKINNKLISENIALSRNKDQLITQLENFNDKLKTANEEIEQLSQTDRLTGLYNRDHFDLMLQKEWSRARRNHVNLTLLIIDIDNFKKVNDSYGHLSGDHALKLVANVLKDTFRRADDFIARLGGDEFAILLYNSSALDAEKLAQNLYHNPILIEEHQQEIRFSIGICSLKPNEHNNPHELMKKSDVALYEAKAKGKNTVCLAP